MKIPTNKLEKFAREHIDQCLASQTSRLNQYTLYSNYVLSGSENPSQAALFNKTYAYIDDLESLLYSPVSLRFHIGDEDDPNILNVAKGRAASGKLRNLERRSETDTLLSESVFWSLVKGKAFIKSNFRRGNFSTSLVQPECFGVYNEIHNKLDEDMECFVHSILITADQFARLVWNKPNRDELLRKAKNYVNNPEGPPGRGADRQVITGGLYPFQPAGTGTPNRTSGIVDWMGLPKPIIGPQVERNLLRLDELWVWNNDQEDWSTFQLIGNDILIMGDVQLINAFAYDPKTHHSVAELKGKHPFTEIGPNRIDGYFWGRSEIQNVALLQEALNSRINGINKLLRKQEDPTRTFVGASGINQVAYSRFNKPGSFYAEQNPNAKIQLDKIDVPADLGGWMHEIERMFDEMGGLPPIARGRGEAGVRSGNHAETLIRMFSPRFKDRALLVERDVEALGGLHLDMARVHIAKKITAWVPKDAAGLEEDDLPNPLILPPAEGLVPVRFAFADLEEDVTLSIDSHSSSPAFSKEAMTLAFDLLKIGAMGPEDVVEHVDVSDPAELTAGIVRREIAKAKAVREQEALKLIAHAPKKG